MVCFMPPMNKPSLILVLIFLRCRLNRRFIQRRSAAEDAVEGPQHQRMFCISCAVAWPISSVPGTIHGKCQRHPGIPPDTRCCLPTVASEDRGVVFKYIGEGDQVGGWQCMITRSLPLVALMRSQWEGSEPEVRKWGRLRWLTPKELVARAVAVDFYDA